MKKIEILDSTLREGQQAVHPLRSSQAIILTRKQQIMIAKLLIDFGIDYIEIGSPVRSPYAFQTAKTIIQLPRKNTKILIHCRCRKEDIDPALELNPDGINLFIGTSRQNLRGQDKIFSDALKLAKDSVAYLRSQNKKIFLRISPEDAFRTTSSDLTRFVNVFKHKADRIGLPDTTGMTTPEDVYAVVKLVGKIKERNMDLEFHAHNDRELAVANCRSAWLAGVTVLNSTILGIGERNGVPSLSALIAAFYLEDSELMEKKYNLKLLPLIDKKLAKMIGIEIPHNIPITAPGAFSHVSGVHVKSMIKNNESYQVLNPKKFGRKTRLFICSSVIGKAAVSAQARRQKIRLSKDQASKTADQIRESARRLGTMSARRVNELIFANNK